MFGCVVKGERVTCPLSVIPVPNITLSTIDRETATAPTAPTCRSQWVDQMSVAILCRPIIVTFGPLKGYPISKSPFFFDPWAKRDGDACDAWRRRPVFSNHVMLVNGFPGFGIALVACSVFVMAENRKGKHRAVEGVWCDELHTFNCGGALTCAS